MLVIGSILEQALEGAIITRLPGIKTGNEPYLFSDDAAPLRGFNTKIRMAFALGLLGEGARSDLSLIRSIRNTFAHSRLDISFESPEVAKSVKFFTLSQRAPQFLNTKSAVDACQVFIDVGYQYALQLIVYEEMSFIDGHAAKILDLPETPKAQQLAALLALQHVDPSQSTPSSQSPSSSETDQLMPQPLPSPDSAPTWALPTSRPFVPIGRPTPP